jgi:hypothetical protein
MKRTISLSNPAETQLKALAAKTDATPSTIVETAIRLLADLADGELANAVLVTQFGKRALSPARWRSAFWETLSKQMGVDYSAFEGRLPYGPRTFRGCHVVFLLPNIDGREDGTITVHAFEDAAGKSTPPETYRWDYRVGDDVRKAAALTAAWIDEIAQKQARK